VFIISKNIAQIVLFKALVNRLLKDIKHKGNICGMGAASVGNIAIGIVAFVQE